MTQKKYTKLLLVFALVCVSLGGWLLHLKIHPPGRSTVNYIPFITGIVSIIIIPLLFMFKKTVHWGYVLNGMTVILGTVTMAHYSLKNFPETLTFKVIFIYSTLPDIILLFTKFFVGKALFDLILFGYSDNQKTGSFVRYPNMGWWLVHLVTISIIYYLGNTFWR